MKVGEEELKERIQTESELLKGILVPIYTLKEQSHALNRTNMCQYQVWLHMSLGIIAPSLSTDMAWCNCNE
jgi:hypothetical protein